MSKIVGIDLGTTNSLVATVDSGIPLVIADADGQRLTPSVVHFPAGGGPPLVGAAANRVRVLRPQETVYSIKRFMGRRGSDIPREEMLVTYPVSGTGPGPVRIDLPSGTFTPEDISAETPNATPPKRPANWQGSPSSGFSMNRPRQPWPTASTG
jgi:molecular chaperone DnaK